jgi:hypothetical protein
MAKKFIFTLKFFFLKIVRLQKKLYLNEVVRILTGHTVYLTSSRRLTTEAISQTSLVCLIGDLCLIF